MGLGHIRAFGTSGVLPSDAPRRVSMDEESFSPYGPMAVPIMKNMYQKLVSDPILGSNLFPTRGVKVSTLGEYLG